MLKFCHFTLFVLQHQVSQQQHPQQQHPQHQLVQHSMAQQVHQMNQPQPMNQSQSMNQPQPMNQPPPINQLKLSTIPVSLVRLPTALQNLRTILNFIFIAKTHSIKRLVVRYGARKCCGRLMVWIDPNFVNCFAAFKPADPHPAIHTHHHAPRDYSDTQPASSPNGPATDQCASEPKRANAAIECAAQHTAPSLTSPTTGSASKGKGKWR